jgi:hypothetical protein
MRPTILKLTAFPSLTAGASKIISVVPLTPGFSPVGKSGASVFNRFNGFGSARQKPSKTPERHAAPLHRAAALTKFGCVSPAFPIDLPLSISIMPIQSTNHPLEFA